MPQTVTCPQCQIVIDLDALLQADLDVQLKQKIETERLALQEEYDSKLFEREQKLKAEQAETQRLAIAEALEAETQRQREAKEKFVEASRKQDEEYRLLAEEHSRQREENLKLQSDLVEKEKSLEDERKKLAEENEAKLEADRLRVEEETRKRIQDERTLKDAEAAIQMESLRKEAAEYRRKLESTSQQLIGEGQEIALEAALRMAFPTDLIEPVQKGMKGADCIQKIRTNGDVLGIIVWESKRTKSWLNEWTGKLKDDQRTLNADLAILVTQTPPSGMATKAGLVDGVWVTDFPTAISVAAALRSGLIYAASMKVLSSGSDEKSQRLFEYVTSPEFRGNMAAIIETFVAFQTDLAAEKRAMEKQWKKRETTLVRALTASNRIYGSLQGTLGEKALPDIEQNIPKQLEA